MSPAVKSPADGFTLVEMLIAVTVMGVLLLVVAPAFSQLIKNNRMVSEVYNLRAMLSSARSEALSRRSFVTFCHSGDGATCSGDWEQGFIAFTDSDGDGVVEDPDEIFLAREQDQTTLNIQYSDDADRIRFDSRGYARGFEGTFTICDERGAESARGVIVSGVGSVRAAIDNAEFDSGNEADGIANDHDGENLECI